MAQHWLLKSDPEAYSWPDLVRDGWLYTYATVKDRVAPNHLEQLQDQQPSSARQSACGCKTAESKA